MDDKRIVELYFLRSEDAIRQTEKKYGRYCFRVAYNILHTSEDSEECVNDTYLRAWHAMPPHRPSKLSCFLGKITRNLALDRYAYYTADKRFGNTVLVYEEVAECIFHPSDSISIVDEIVMKNAVDSFLASLGKRERMIFLRRYYYFSSVKEIARDFSLTESNVKVILHRTRNQFREYLENEGIEI